jgi:hypothetical protein
MKYAEITTVVEEHYAALARGEASCCGSPVSLSSFEESRRPMAGCCGRGVDQTARPQVIKSE